MNSVDLEQYKDGIPLDVGETLSKEEMDTTIELPSFGISMWPLLHAKGDYIRIETLSREIVKGDVVIYRRESDGKNVAHRVVRVTADSIQTRGDNTKGKDEPTPKSTVFGHITHVRRKGKVICITTRWWRFYGRVMSVTNPVRMFLKVDIYYPLVRLAKKILRRK